MTKTIFLIVENFIQIPINVLNLVGSTRVGSNPVVGTINRKLTAISAVHPSEVGKWVFRRGNSEGTSSNAGGTSVDYLHEYSGFVKKRRQ